MNVPAKKAPPRANGPDTSRSVLPPGFKLHGAPEEREARIARWQALQESLLPYGPEDLDARIHEEILANLERDYTMSVVPPGFMLHEPPEMRNERIKRTLDGIRVLQTGDPVEHRETLEALLMALDGDLAEYRTPDPTE
jgi:hypothetical protein